MAIRHRRQKRPCAVIRPPIPAQPPIYLPRPAPQQLADNLGYPQAKDGRREEGSEFSGRPKLEGYVDKLGWPAALGFKGPAGHEGLEPLVLQPPLGQQPPVKRLLLLGRSLRPCARRLRERVMPERNLVLDVDGAQVHVDDGRGHPSSEDGLEGVVVLSVAGEGSNGMTREVQVSIRCGQFTA